MVKKCNGTIIKTVGAAYIIYFKNLTDCVKNEIDIQTNLSENKIGKNILILSIGMCYGPVYKTKVNAQDVKTIDYLGNTVNSESRIESNVCKLSIAFVSLLKKEKKLDSILKIFGFLFWKAMKKRFGSITTQVLCLRETTISKLRKNTLIL